MSFKNSILIDQREQYDELLFSNYPVIASQPDYLATIATLRGLRPQDVDRARVLQLGCASGANLLPLAERYPRSAFVGIDASERNIALARRTAADLKLANIDFRQQNLFDCGPDLGAFDYIIAHGVYSWVEMPARDKLLAICREHLAPHGVAYVSYNVYPGWHVLDMFRSMMAYEARGAGGSAEQIARGRTLLEFLKASMTPAQTPYQVLIATELEPFLQQTDANLRHDLLSAVNVPVYFQQFIAHARANELQFVGDCTQGIRYADFLTTELEQDLDGVASDAVRKMQYRDILLKRTFRQTLLCHADVEVRQSPTAELIEGLYVEGRIRPENPDLNLRSRELERFFGRGESALSTNAPIIKAALLHLGQIWPKSLRWDELLAVVQSRFAAMTDPPMIIPAADIKRLQENLFECCRGGIVDLHVKPHSFTTAASERPAASPLARLQAARGEIVTNRRHAPIRLDSFDRQVLQWLTGSHDSSQLIDRLAEWASQATIQVMEGQQPVDSPQRVRELIELALPQSLARLRENAFLVS